MVNYQLFPSFHQKLTAISFFLQMIIKLKQEIQQLKDELALSSGMEYKGELTEEEIER